MGTKDKDQNGIIFKIGHLEQLNNNILLGIEFNKYSDVKTDGPNANSSSAFYEVADQTRLHLEDIFSLDVRVGTVLENQDNFLNNSMIYGKIGVATLRSSTRSYEVDGTRDDHIGQSKARHYGSVVGIGIEKKLSIFDDPKISNNTSVSLEYNMMNFNKKTSGSDSGIVVDVNGYSVKPEIKNLLLTINYKLSDNTLGLKNLIK
jgi:hypothetical protein